MANGRRDRRQILRQPVAREQPDVGAALVGEQPDAVELALEQPVGPVKRSWVSVAAIGSSQSDRRCSRLRPNSAAPVDCRFLFTDVSGTTPKFDCELADGRGVKVKYGRTPEISGEIAATRLLTALGFGADHVRLASRVRCYGCPVSPFYSRILAKGNPPRGAPAALPNYAEFRDYEWTAVQEKLDGAEIEAGGEEGWAFFELNQIDPARGGAPLHEVDALRLMAVFLAHWDNKLRNQRLVCLSPVASDDAVGRHVAMLQDVGAAFKAEKGESLRVARPVNLDGPSGLPREHESLPHDGATFGEVTISEQGRRLLSDRLVACRPSSADSVYAKRTSQATSRSG